MKLNKLSKTILLFTVIVNLIISILYCFKILASAGDESHFVNDLALIYSKGWVFSIEKGISIPYMIIAYLFSFIHNSYLLFRVVNLCLFLLLIFYFYKRKVSFLFYIILLFFVSTSKVFFLGTNDTFFFFGLIIFFCEVYFLNKYKIWNSSLALSCLVLSFFTRELFLVYIPAVLFAFYIIYKNTSVNNIAYKMPVFLGLFFLVLNIPSLQTNFILSYDVKAPDANAKSNWTQRNYLSQLMINEGNLPSGQHASWIETDEYLIKNGKNSLPKGIIESVFFDVKLTVLEFFKNIINASFYGFRQLSLVYVFPFIILFVKRKNYLTENFIPIISILTLFAFGGLLILNIELRWLIGVFIPLILYFSEINITSKWFRSFNYLNIVFLFIMNFYAIITLSIKLKNQILS